jgi:hypothetical protein
LVYEKNCGDHNSPCLNRSRRFRQPEPDNQDQKRKSSRKTGAKDGKETGTQTTLPIWINKGTTGSSPCLRHYYQGSLYKLY